MSLFLWSFGLRKQISVSWSFGCWWLKLIKAREMECRKWNKPDWLCAEAKKYRSNKCKFREKHCTPINLCIKTSLFFPLKKQWEKQIEYCHPKVLSALSNTVKHFAASSCSSANFFLGGCIWTVISIYLLQPEKPNTLEIGHWSRTPRDPQLIPSIAGSTPFSHVGVNSLSHFLSQQLWDNLLGFVTRLWGHQVHAVLYKPDGDG